MNRMNSSKALIVSGLVFLTLPALIYSTGDTAPTRTILKDSISILTIIAFFQMLGQFYLARSIKYPIAGHVQKEIFGLHILLGCLCTTLLLVHPLLIVLPHYFESGISPLQAFMIIITTGSPGVLTGLAAWLLLLTIFISSLLRNRIPLRYRDWRRLHGLMSSAFIVLGGWHAIYLGRHMNRPLSAYIIVLFAAGLFSLMQKYISEQLKERERKRWVLPEKSTPYQGEVL